MITLPLAAGFLFMSAPLPQSPDSRPLAENAEAVCPLLPGMKVPEVLVRNLEGESVSLAQILSGKPSVLIFYRGGW